MWIKQGLSIQANTRARLKSTKLDCQIVCLECPLFLPGKRTYYLKFIRYGRLDQAPMVLQDSPKGLQEYMAESKYTTLKERMDHAVLPVYVTARRVQFMMWMSSAVLVMALIVFVVLLLIHVQAGCRQHRSTSSWPRAKCCCGRLRTLKQQQGFE